MPENQNNELSKLHILLSKSNILFLDAYIQSHSNIRGYSDAIRIILTELEDGDQKSVNKINLIGKNVSIILEILKANNPDGYTEAKSKVEELIQYRTTQKANQTIPKNKPEAKQKSLPNFLGN